MKKFYEAVQMNIVLFDNVEVIVASAVEDTTSSSTSSTTYYPGNDETEML